MSTTTLRALAVVLLGCACAGRPGSGDAVILVRVEVDPRLETGCVKLDVRDLTGAVLTDTRIPRGKGDNTLYVAVYRGDLPEQVGLVARASKGKGCDAPQTPLAESTEERKSFESGRVNEVTLSISCGSAEVCDDGADNDCNGATDCADGSCANKACGPGGQTCAASACACPTGQKLCNATCIPQSSCCADADCSAIQGQTCQSGTCACPSGQRPSRS